MPLNPLPQVGQKDTPSWTDAAQREQVCMLASPLEERLTFIPWFWEPDRE
jgi:hypothetical protein